MILTILLYIWLNTTGVGIPFPSTPYSEQWVAWTLLVLAALLLLTLKFRPKLIGNGFRTITSVKERESIFLESTSGDGRTQFSMSLYVLGILALTLYLLIFNGQTTFQFLTFICISGILIAFFMLKYALNRFLVYVYFDRNIFQVCRRHYILLVNTCAVLLYPIALLYIYLPEGAQPFVLILYGLCALFFAVVFVLKVFYFFFHKPLGLFYILLYLCALEILPLMGLLWIVQKIL